MQRVVQYVAEDGTSFSDPDECAEYDRNKKFQNELFNFLIKTFPTEEQESLQNMDKLWAAIYDCPEKFQVVLDAAKPKPRRGRPRTKKAKQKSPIKNTIQETVATEPAPTQAKKKRKSIISRVPTNAPWRPDKSTSGNS